MKIKVSVALEEELVDRLDKIGAISHESRSHIVERMVREQIAAMEQFANMMANPKAREMFVDQFSNPETFGMIARSMGAQPDEKLQQGMIDAVERISAEVQEVKKGKGKKR